MKCAICKNGSIAPGSTTVVLERDSSIVVIRNVPAEVCDNCGEYYLNQKTTREVMRRADEAVYKGAEVEILRYAA